MAGPEGLQRIRDRVGAGTHADPNKPSQAQGPVHRVSATSNAPISLHQLYDWRTHRWNPRYVQPTEYRLFLQRTQADPTMIDPITWQVKSDDGRFPTVEVADNGIHVSGLGAPAKGTVVATVPFAGPVSVSSTYKGNRMESKIDLRDFLVVSIGDSFSSGQGNPDQPGVESVGSRALCEVPTLTLLIQAIADATEKGLDWVEDNIPVLGDIVNLSEWFAEGLVDTIGDALDGIGDSLGFGGADEFTHMTTPPTWLEPLAWRSLKSAMSLATQDAEIRGWGRLTTFVSVASSGAEIESGLLRPQRGFQQFGQVEELRRMLTDPRDRTKLIRPVDVLMMSIGGNDCGFSGTLSDLTGGRFAVGMIARKTPQKQARDTIEKAIKGLAKKYDALDDVIRRSLDPTVIMVPQYPAPIFDSTGGQPAAGCGVFDLAEAVGAVYPIGISKSDAAFIEEMGNTLNDAIAAAGQRNNWVVVDGVAKAFKRHGYCSRQTYWRSASDSCHMQGDLEGTAHPNTGGTRVVAELLGKQLHKTLNDLVANNPAAGVRRKTPGGPDRQVIATGRRR